MNKLLIFATLLLSILILPAGIHKAFSQEIVNCNPDDEIGECPSDVRFHRCQIVEDNGVTQSIILGKCNHVEEDINDDGDLEVVCKCEKEVLNNEDSNKNDDEEYESGSALNIQSNSNNGDNFSTSSSDTQSDDEDEDEDEELDINLNLDDVLNNAIDNSSLDNIKNKQKKRKGKK